jgi:malate/lactate dehydrogenase
MYPDVSSARWEGKRLTDLLSPDWIRNELVSTVRGRADTLLSLRGYDSLHSVVIAIMDTIRDLEDPRGGFHSVGVYTDGQHGIKGDLIFSMPTRIRNGQLEVAENWVHSAEATKILEENIQELEKEKEVARRLLES